jgi:integrase/recombinase XerD
MKLMEVDGSNAAVVPMSPPRLLNAPEFQRLTVVPPESQWFANLDCAQTRRAYQCDLKAFMAFTGIVRPEEFRSVTRSHVLAWRADLEKKGCGIDDPAQVGGTGLLV